MGSDRAGLTRPHRTGPPLTRDRPWDDQQRVAGGVEVVAVAPAPGPKVEGEHRTRPPDFERGSGAEVAECALEEHVPAVVEAELLKVDSRRQ
jgi:hypothetical protein